MGPTTRWLHFLASASIFGFTQFTSAQALNIDLGGSSFSKPSNAYGAAAVQVGYWNSEADSPLRDLRGALTAVTAGWYGSEIGGSSIGTKTDEGLFMTSYFRMFNGVNAYRIAGLSPGVYDLYLYGWGGAALDRAGVTGFAVFDGRGNTLFGSVSFERAWPGRQIDGKTYDAVRIEITPATGIVAIQVSGDSGGKTPFGIFNGLQVVPVPAPASALPLLGLGLRAIRRRRS